MQPRKVRVATWLKLQTDTDEGNPWVVTTWFQIPVGADEPAVSTAIQPNAELPWWVWGAGPPGSPVAGNGLKGATSSVIDWYWTECSANTALTTGPATITSAGPPTSGIASVRQGSRGASPAPQPLALVVQKRSNLGTSRQWGRNYIPCLTGDVATDGGTIPASTGAVATAISNMVTFSSPSGYKAVNVNSDGFARDITAVAVTARIGVQRRRLR